MRRSPPKTTNALLGHVGVDPEVFRRDHVQPLVDAGWAQRLAEAAALAELSADDAESWESREDMRAGRQVVALVRSDYSEGSPLLEALTAAGQRAALWIRMLASSRSE